MEGNFLSMGFSNLPEILKLFSFGPLFTLKLLRTEKTFLGGQPNQKRAPGAVTPSGWRRRWAGDSEEEWDGAAESR